MSITMDISEPMEHDNGGDVCEALAERLERCEDMHKVFDFSHVIVTGCVVDIMDSSFRSIIDGMYRRTKSHCKTDEESEAYRQRLCKLYLTYLERGLARMDRLEPTLADILTVERSTDSDVGDRLAELRAKVDERRKRVQGLLALRQRLKTDTVLAAWVISKVEPIVDKADSDLATMKNVSPNYVQTVFNNFKDIEQLILLLNLD